MMELGTLCSTMGSAPLARAGEWAWTRIYDELAPKVIGYLRAQGAADPEDVGSIQILRSVQIVQNRGRMDDLARNGRRGHSTRQVEGLVRDRVDVLVLFGAPR
jgi:hypothetical protein